MWKLITREIAARKSRFVAAVVAVALGVAFLSLTLGVKNLALNALTQAETSTLNGDLYAVGTLAKHANPLDLDARTPIDASLAEAIEAVEGVSHAAPIFEGEAVLLDAHKHPLTLGFGATRVRGSYAFPPGPTLAEGRLPRGMTEVMLETSTAQRAGLKVGGTATLIWGGTVHRVKIVGTAGFDAPLGTATLAFVEASYAKTWFSPESRVKLIGIKVGAAADIRTVKERVQEAVGSDAKIVEGAKLRAESAAGAGRTLGFVNTLVWCFVALSLLAGAFLIANIFGILVTARYRALGLLRAVGYGPAALRRLVLGQALIVGVLGSVLGSVLGGVLTAAVRALLMRHGYLLTDGWFSVSELVVGGFMLVAGVVTTLAAATIPTWRAGRIPPLSALELGVNAEVDADEKPVRGRVIVGGVLLVVAAGGTGLGLWLSESRLDGAVVLALGLSGVVGLVGLLLVLARLLGLVTMVFAALTRGLNVLPARLALQNLRRYPRRTTLGAAALVVGVAVGTAGGVVADSARASLQVSAVHEVQSDLVVASLQPSTSLDKVLREIREVPGVTSASAGVIGAPVLLRQDKGAGGVREVPAAGVNLVEMKSSLRLKVNPGSMESLERGEVLVNTRVARANGWKLGDPITITGALGVYSTRIGGLVNSSLVRAAVFLDAQYLRQTAAPEQMTRQYIFVNIAAEGVGSDAAASLPTPGGDQIKPATLTSVQQRIQKILDPYYVFKVMTPHELAQTAATPTTNLVLLMHGLLGFSVIIALLGVMNMLALTVLERRLTYNLLRVIGMKPREVGALVRWEAFFLTLLGALIGWSAGLVLGLAWRFALRHEGLAVVSVPWLAQGGLILVAVILAVVVAMIPARQSERAVNLMYAQDN